MRAGIQTPFMASETTAARLFDLDTRKFNKLVADGHFPQGVEIAPGVLRWDTEMLKKVASGGGADGWGQIDW